MIVKNIIANMSKQSFHLVRRKGEGSIKSRILQPEKKYPHQQRRTTIPSCCTAYSMRGNIGQLNRQHIPLRRQRKDTSLFPMEHVLFHGNNKSEEELRLALALGVGRIVLDNWSELERLTRIAREAGLRPKVLLRVTPSVETDTHRYLQTGHAASKFGFPLSNGEAKAALRQILNDGRLHLMGLHTHIGTML
ncbi:MAG: hypothetical protein ACJ8DI_13190, partial [Ktedonobacteraceae bacterium]